MRTAGAPGQAIDKGPGVLHSRRVSRPALGRGLGALLGGASTAAKIAPPAPLSPPPIPELAAVRVPAPAPSGEPVLRVPIGQIRACPFQPRKDFPTEALQELANSIREQGIVQPLIVRPHAQGFELIAGERRWRAAQLAGLTEVPVIVREADDRKVLELALIENLQRENLNPMEEAQGYAQLIEQFQLRQEDAAQRVGRSRAVVANALRLLRLPVEVQAYVRDGLLSVGHAKVILGLSTPDEQALAAEKVLKATLNVRQTEELVTRLLGQASTASPARTGSRETGRDVHVAALETRLQERFGTKVLLRYRQGKGALEIKFYSDEDLNRLLNLVGVNLD